MPLLKLSPIPAFLVAMMMSGAAHAGHQWADFGLGICEARGEGIHVLRYDNGEVKASIVCGEHEDVVFVKQARYFDRNGRGLAHEENVPSEPSRSFYREWIYDGKTGAPREERLYDGKGTLVKSGPPSVTTAVARSSHTWIPGTFNDYLSYCRSEPEAMLIPALGPLDGRQFFDKTACRCVAEKALRLDEERDSDFMLSKQLDPDDHGDRVSLAAARSLQECLCPDAVPGSRLEEICRQNPPLDEIWGKKRD